MYILEAVPTVLLGIAVLVYVTDRPTEARWLGREESAWLTETLESERRLIEKTRTVSLLRSFWDPKVLLLSLNYLGIVTASLGMLLFLPQMIKQLGFTNMQVGWVTMIPYICGAIAMLTWGWLSDRMAERRWNLFAGCLVAGIGLVSDLGMSPAQITLGLLVNLQVRQLDGGDQAVHVVPVPPIHLERPGELLLIRRGVEEPRDRLDGELARHLA
jgi:ACS family tartrate transporter-like MFS transporter